MHQQLHIRHQRVAVALTADQMAIVSELKALAETQGWSQGETARNVGVHPATITRLINNTYTADPAKVIRRVEDYLSLVKARSHAGDAVPFVETSLARWLWSIADMTRTQQMTSILVGNAQWGKTTAALQYAETRLNTVYVRCPSNPSPSRIIKRIASALKCPPYGSLDDVLQRVCNALTQQHILIVDEIHQILMSDKLGVKVIEILREVHDITRAGLLLIATPIFARAMLNDDKWQGVLSQFALRGFADYYPMPTCISHDDLCAIWTHYGLPDPDIKMLNSISTQANIYGFGRFIKRIRAAYSSAHKRGEKFNWASVAAINARLDNLSA